MDLKQKVGAAVLAGGLGLAGVLGVGSGSAAAQPGGCGAPNAPACGPNQPGPDQPGPGQNNWQTRGFAQGRQDHQPFNWNGHQVTPLPAGNGSGWGFWFFGQWIPL